MQKVYNFLGALVILVLAKTLPFNSIIGSQMSSFSLSSIVAPVLGFYVGTWTILGFFMQKSLFSLSFFAFFLHRLPLLFSTQAFLGKNIVTSWIIPGVCMTLFVMHPEGMQAWVYALYWFIPMACYFCAQTIFIRALSSSFVAHATGSVVWLYTGSIGAATWWALIPVVACERLLMTIGIVSCYYLYPYVVQIVKKIFSLKVTYSSKGC